MSELYLELSSVSTTYIIVPLGSSADILTWSQVQFPVANLHSFLVLENFVSSSFG